MFKKTVVLLVKLLVIVFIGMALFTCDDGANDGANGGGNGNGENPALFQQVSAGGNHTVGIRPDGSLWAWGYNMHGQLGDGTTINKHTPTRIGTDTWTSVFAGSAHTVGIRTDGSLWAWGSNYEGQLGDGTTTNRLIPTQIFISE